jgi:hypothetical protein
VLGLLPDSWRIPVGPAEGRWTCQNAAVNAPWWRAAEEAAQLIASHVGAEVDQAARHGRYDPPPGTPEPRRRRKVASLRHLTEVIRTHRLAPGASVDKDIVAGVLAGDLRHVSEPTVVIAVAHAAHIIAGTPFGDEEAKRLAVGCERLTALIAVAREADQRASSLTPAPLAPSEAGGRAHALAPVRLAPSAAPEVALEAFPIGRRPGRRLVTGLLAVGAAVVAATVTAVVMRGDNDPQQPATTADLGCEQDAADAAIIRVSTDVFRDDEATRLNPTLDFDQMNGSARYARHNGLTYYWGRAGSDDDRPAAGGARVRWRTPGGPWHSCPAPLAVTERGYVHTPAVAMTIPGPPVTVQVCLWRADPYRENCTPEIATG